MAKSQPPSELGTAAYLPAGRLADPGQEGHRQRASGPSAPARLLLVDDDAAVLEITGELLRHAGHHVVSAANGEEALGVLSRSEPFDVIVTDYAMPGITGRELVIQARRLCPSLPAILVTGFAGRLMTEQLPPGIVILKKPFQIADLVQTVQRFTTRVAASMAPAAGFGRTAPGEGHRTQACR